MSRQQIIGLSIWAFLGIAAASLEDRSGFLLYFLLPLSLTVNVLFIGAWAYGAYRVRKTSRKFDDIFREIGGLTGRTSYAIMFYRELKTFTPRLAPSAKAPEASSMIVGIAVFIWVCLSAIVALAACVAAGDADQRAGMK